MGMYKFQKMKKYFLYCRWFIKAKQSNDEPKNPTIVFFHENAGSKFYRNKNFIVFYIGIILDIGTRLEYLESYLLFTHFNFLIVAYRG